MSNSRAWRRKKRTAKPNSRQKRTGLFLDAHPVCPCCWSTRSTEAHALPHDHPSRNLWIVMGARCEPCHIRAHAHVRISYG